MNFLETPHFKRAYKSLPEELKNHVKDALRKLAADIRYPSLQVKKIKGTKYMWAMRVTLDCRITFQMVRDYIILCNVGKHDATLKYPS